MAHLKVLTLPDHRLRIKAKPVKEVDDTIRKELEDMAETMYTDDGIGLAATQVNIHKRMLVMDLRDHDDQIPNTLLKIVNPEVVWASDEIVVENEACMSLPELRVPVSRPERIRLKYQDETGAVKEFEVGGLAARCLQHEMDHLVGKLAVDYLSPLKKGMAMKKLEKIKRLSEE